MKKLWAPWRAEYIRVACAEKQGHCLFCFLKDSRSDLENLVLYRGKNGFIVMNRFPYNSGHLMVAPYRHTANLQDLKDDEARAIFALIQKCVAVLKKEYQPQGFNIGANLGAVAGAGVTGHIHFHIVPRWQGDTNFMPLLTETKVISEHLVSTYNRLFPHFNHKRRK